MSRINKEREQALQPQRMRSTKDKLIGMGFNIAYEDETRLEFIFNNERVSFWPYSVWHSGKSIKSGRGFSRLLRQLI